MKVTQGRKIPKNYRNITGKFFSRKIKGSIAFESKLERDYYMLFELDNSISIIKEQPVTLQSETTRLKYTPDFEIFIHTNGVYKTIIGEIKYKKDLKKDWETLRPKFEMAIEYCNSKENTEFKIFTNACPKISSQDYLFNTHFLLNFKQFNHKNYHLLRSNYKPNITINELLKASTDNISLQMELLSTVWYLIKIDVIKTDLFIKLSTSSILQKFKIHDEPSAPILIKEGYYPRRHT